MRTLLISKSASMICPNCVEKVPPFTSTKVGITNGIAVGVGDDIGNRVVGVGEKVDDGIADGDLVRVAADSDTVNCLAAVSVTVAGESCWDPFAVSLVVVTASAVADSMEEKVCPAVEKLDTFWAGHKRGIGWPRAAASNSAGVR